MHMSLIMPIRTAALFVQLFSSTMKNHVNFYYVYMPKSKRLYINNHGCIPMLLPYNGYFHCANSPVVCCLLIWYEYINFISFYGTACIPSNGISIPFDIYYDIQWDNTWIYCDDFDIRIAV